MELLKMGYLTLKIYNMTKFLIFSKIPWAIYIVHGILPKLGRNMTVDFNTPSETAYFKLSEKHKINKIEQSKLKLWPLRDTCSFNDNHWTLILAA